MKDLINLRLFDEGGGSGTGTGGGEGQGEAQGGVTQSDIARHFRNPEKASQYTGVAKGEKVEDATAPVAAGENEQTEETAPKEQSPEDRKREFDEFLAKYKDLDIERTNGIINRRFKEVKTLEERVGKLDPVVNLLMEKYGVDSVDKLTKAIEEDHSLWEDEADKAGMTVEQYRKFKQLEQDNQRQQQELEAQRAEDEARRRVQGWVIEGEELQKRFPAFDLRAEMANPDFTSMLERGIPMEHAFKVVHFDELTSGVAELASKEGQKAAAANIRNKQSRPKESGSGPSAGVVVKSDVQNLTRAERAEYLRRAQRGESIKFD